MSENVKPNISLSLVDEMPETIERGTVYLSPSDENGFIKVGIDSTTAATIYDSSAMVSKSDIGNAKVFYGTCDTSADVSIKDVSCLDFTSNDLVKGAAIFVTFGKTNSASVDTLRLNVNNTGVKGLKKLRNAGITALSSAGELYLNSTHLFTYTGTNWVSMTTDYNTNTTYSGMTEADYEAGTGTTAKLITPARLKGAIEYWMEQNQADWDATTGPSFILNKPFVYDTSTYSISAITGNTPNNTLSGKGAVIMGINSEAKGDNSFIDGADNMTRNYAEHASGMFNVSRKGETIFSVGVGGSKERRNAFEIDSSGLVYVLGVRDYTGTEDAVLGPGNDLATTINDLRYDIARMVSNVQSNWDATTGLAEILNRPDWLLEKKENILNVNTDMAAYNPYSYNYIFNRMEGGYRFVRPNTAQNAITFGVSDLCISESEMPATEELYIPIDNTTFLADDSSMHVFMDIVLNSGISLPASILTDDRDLADIYGYIRLDFIEEDKQYTPVYAFRSKNLSTLYDGFSRYVTNCTVSFTKLSEQYENNIWRISEDGYTNEYNVALPIKQEYRKSFYYCSVLSIGNAIIDLETDLSFRLIDGVTICINLANEINSGRTIRLNVNDTGSRAIVNGRNSIVSYINSGTSILTYSEASNKWVYVSDIPEVGSGFLYIRKNGQNIIGKSYYDSTVEMSFNANIGDEVVYDISVNELPDVSTADNGKIMMVVNGQWSMVEPVAIYSGDGDPSNNLGKNGDLYLQTGE